MKRGDLIDRTRTFRARFVDGTLPFLIEHGWDWSRSGLVERMDDGGGDTGTQFRRVMVHARQLYVFSSWGARTGKSDLVEHADRIFGYMTEHFWDDELGGWIEKVDLDGIPVSLDKDLYAHAFALFGLGAYARHLGRDEKIWVERTRDVLERRFRRGDGSYRDRMSRAFEDLAPDRRSQNPHMHLLEAALSLSDVDPAIADLARRLITLFGRTFLDAEKHVVLEHLGPDFAPDPQDGRRVEPGHHFEWAWLLDWASRVLGQPKLRKLAAPILEKGLALGWDSAAAGVFDEVDRRDGSVLLSSKRIWPLLELIKALSVFPKTGRAVNAGTALELLLARYLDESGLWTERFNADWTPADQTLPSSTAYHISMALEELERSAG